MNIKTKILSAIFAVVCMIVVVQGHGRLLEPPSRSSMHRYKQTDSMLITYHDIIEANYNDNELNCGGRDVHISNDGKCGVCGDPYTAAVKENEAGGKYAKGIITRNYEQGQMIDVTVEITAAHKGYFEFRLCPWNNVHVPITHECLDQNVLTYESGETTYHIPEDSNSAKGLYHLKVRLPEDITCGQCVLQWKYRTGNSWGEENGPQGIGFGQQEEFYGCSDVSIKTGLTLPTASIPTTTKTTQSSTTTTSTNGNEVTTTKTTTESTDVELYPDVNCSQVKPGQAIFRDCHSFFICSSPSADYDPFIFGCPAGTVCDPTSGECKLPQDVPYCSN